MATVDEIPKQYGSETIEEVTGIRIETFLDFIKVPSLLNNLLNTNFEFETVLT